MFFFKFIFHRPPITEDATVVFMYQIGKDNSYEEKDKLIVPLPNVTIQGNTTGGVHLKVTASKSKAGNMIVGVNSSSPELTKYKSY